MPTLPKFAVVENYKRIESGVQGPGKPPCEHKLVRYNSNSRNYNFLISSKFCGWPKKCELSFRKNFARRSTFHLVLESFALTAVGLHPRVPPRGVQGAYSGFKNEAAGAPVQSNGTTDLYLVLL